MAPGAQLVVAAGRDRAASVSQEGLMIDQYLGILVGVFVVLPLIIFVGLPIFIFLVVGAFKIHWILGVISIPAIPMIWVAIWDELDGAVRRAFRSRDSV
jgi:hypothetical protein